MEELGYQQKVIVVHEDNEACIKLTKNPERHKYTKHIQVKYHKIREYVEAKLMEVIYCDTKSQLVDMQTKILPGSQLRKFCEKLGILSGEGVKT